MKKRYTLTDEHRALLKPWADKWIANAMSTKAMDDADRDAMRTAITGLYEAANLTPPPAARIVFVPSPLVGNMAAGFAAGIWWLRKRQHDATLAATDAATGAATRAATSAATLAATDDATNDATRAATYDATSAATDAATNAATDAATLDAWAFHLAVKWGPRKFMIECARNAWRMCNGGNHWSGWCAYLSFFRHVVKLPIDYAKFQHYEAAATHGSWRWVHEDFCIVSDRPKTLKIDHMRRPHCDDGPSHEWRDGWKLYHWHGLRIPAELIERRHEMTPKSIMAISNAEHRRAAIEIYAHIHGPDKFVRDLGATLVASDKCLGHPRRLYRLGDQQWVHVINGSKEPDGTRREFLLGVPNDVRTPHDAVAWSYGRPAEKYKEAVRT